MEEKNTMETKATTDEKEYPMKHKPWQGWEFQLLEKRFNDGYEDEKIAEALMRPVSSVKKMRSDRGLVREEKKKPDGRGEDFKKLYENQKVLKEQNIEIITVLKEIRDILQRSDASILELAGQGRIAADIQKKKLEMITKGEPK